MLSSGLLVARIHLALLLYSPLGEIDRTEDVDAQDRDQHGLGSDHPHHEMLFFSFSFTLIYIVHHHSVILYTTQAIL